MLFAIILGAVLGLGVGDSWNHGGLLGHTSDVVILSVGLVAYLLWVYRAMSGRIF